MRKRLLWLLAILLISSFALSACGGGSTPTEAPAEPIQAQVSEPDEPEPTAVPEPQVATAADLASAYQAFLSDMQGYNTIKMDALAEELLDEPPPFLLDVRTTGELEENGHITGAVHIPLAELGQNLDLLPSFDTPIVAYCGSGWRATIAMSYLGAAGWTDVRAFKTRFSDWAAAGYAVEPGLAAEAFVLDAAEPDSSFVAAIDQTLSTRAGWGGIGAEDLNLALTDNPDIFLIDVRRQVEVDEKGVIEADNFVHIPIEVFAANSDMLPADKDTTITVYCGSGHRSTMAMAMLWTYGYDNVTSLSGGFGGWVSAGYSVLGGAPDLASAYTAFLDDMVAYNTIKMDALAVELLDEPPPFLLDVRTTGELEENGHITGAVHIPLAELGQNLDLLPSFDTPIVAYCGSGWRATIAMSYLGAAGWTDVRAFKTRFSDWVAAGYAVEPGLAAEAFVLDASQPDSRFVGLFDEVLSAREGWGGIKAGDLNLALTDNPDIFVIDVRRTEEVEEKGVIEAANFAHIPIEEFIAGIDMWPVDTDTTITVYCGSGHRSTMAMAILWTYGYDNVTSLSGGFGGWVDAGYPVVEYAMQ
jgi:rhodanese-related sulfurtransferase